MSLQLNEGQDFTADYTLVRRLNQNERVQSWLAIDKNLNEQVYVKIFTTAFSENVRRQIEETVLRQKGLLHPQIARIFRAGSHEGADYIVSQYIEGGKKIPLNGDFKQAWSHLSEAAVALQYAHSLGFAHGHLHPNNILINNNGSIFLTDFGIGTSDTDNSNRAYLSPQVKSHQPINTADDVFSFGQLVYHALTGNIWLDELGFESNLPVSDEFKQTITTMLQLSPYDRPNDFTQIIKSANAYLGGTQLSSDLEVSAFSRATDAPSQQNMKPSEQISENPHTLPRDRETISSTNAIGGLAILVVIGLSLFFFLPVFDPVASVTTQHTPSKVTSQNTAPTEANEPVLGPLEQARLKKLQEEGEALANELLRLQIELEDLGGLIWASIAYAEALNFGLAGDEAYRNGEIKNAFELYTQGIELLKATIATSDDIFTNNQIAGSNALEDGDSRIALEAYTILAAMDPSDELIKANLKRAENLEEVQRFVRDGQLIENNGDLASALSHYENANRLDMLWTDASVAIARVRQKIANNEFNEMMSIAFRTLKQGKFDDSREAFESAQKILPESSEPKDGLQQVELQRLQVLLEKHKVQSIEFVDQENWAGAIQAFDEILTKAPGTLFAIDGLDEAQNRLDLEKKMLEFVSQPASLADNGSLSDAKKVLLTAARIKPKGTQLKEQISHLSHLISQARIPVKLQLQSDNKTNVSLLKHKNFGRIQSTELNLIPGIYTFVGERQGYRAVYKEVTLKGGQPIDPILISCTEKI